MLNKKFFSEYKENLIIALPIMASQVGHISVGIADSIMVGKIGGHALAAATVAFSIYIPFMMLGIGISYGVTPLVAKAHGENNPKEIANLLKHSIILNLITGLVIGLLLYSLSFSLRLFKQPTSVVELAIPFFELLAISTIPLMLFQAFRQFAEGLSITFPSMLISITGNLINIALNYVLIKGNFGFTAYGVNGAGYATLTSRILMALGMFIFVYYHKSFKEYWNILRTIPYSVKEYFKMIKISIPVGAQLTLEAGAFGFAAIMVGWIGADEIAAHHVALNMAAVSYMAATGISSAATVRVGNELGRKDYKALKLAGNSAFHLVIVLMSMSALLFILLRHTLPQFYVNEERIIHLAVGLLLISAYFQLSDGLQVVGLGALRGLGDVKVPTMIALLAYWIIGLPLGHLLAFHFKMGVEGVWYGLLTGLTVAALFLYLRFKAKIKGLLNKELISK